MDGSRTRGHPAAIAAVAGMIRGPVPHAVLLVGPSGVGKTTLALDLAAGLLCTAEDPAGRPCGQCRACRLVASGSHADVHRLGPEGPGRQVVIGGPERPRGVRDLIAELALAPAEGGARVAIIEAADRMNEDAQSALLKTLEEPPAGVTIVLCADAEEPLLPTIRSRCARLHLGPVAVRDVEAILAAQGLADPPTAARLARIAAGRPGVAAAWAADPEAVTIRDELTRSLLDLADAGIADRLAGVRAAAARAGRLAGVVDGATPGAGGVGAAGAAGPRKAAGRGRRAAAAAGPVGQSAAGADDGAPGPDADAADGSTDASPSTDGEAAKVPASERRRAAEALLAIWTDLTRDLALCQIDRPGDVREVGLLDETQAVSMRLSADDVLAFLDRLGRASVLIRANVAPALILDDLAVAWPRPQRRPAVA